MTVVESIARKLGGAAVIGHEVRSQGDLARGARAPAARGAQITLPDAGLNNGEIEKTLIIPGRTRRHRAQKGQPLTVEESDPGGPPAANPDARRGDVREFREGCALAAASSRRTRGEAPLVVAQTEAGARVIETILGQIACALPLDAVMATVGAAHARAFDGGYGLLQVAGTAPVEPSPTARLRHRFACWRSWSMSRTRRCFRNL